MSKPIHCKHLKVELDIRCPNPVGFCLKCEHYEETEMLPYVKVSNVGDLLKILQEYPHNMKLSQFNQDGTITASTRFYLRDGILTFGYEGDEDLLERIKELENELDIHQHHIEELGG